jgi:membrane protease subunit HflC
MSNRQRVLLIGLVVGLVLVLVLVNATLFVVDERQLAVVLQFGEPVASYTEPGLKVKAPFVQEVRYFPKTYQFSVGAGGGVLENLPTADGKNIEVTAWTIWRITDPEQFVRVLREVQQADLRVAELVRSEVRKGITSNKLAEVVRSTDRELAYPVLTDLLRALADEAEEPGIDRKSTEEPQPNDEGAPGQPTAAPLEESLQDWLKAQIETKEKIDVGRERIVEDIKQKVQGRLAEIGQEEQAGRGIELVDLGIGRIDFADAVREKAFERQIARWESIAGFYTSQGDKEKLQIINRAKAKAEEILGEGSKEASRTRGEADARIIDAYAEAIEETGEFYRFVRTLEAYKEAMGQNTRLVLTTDSELFTLLKQVPPAPPPSPDEPAAEDASKEPEPPTPKP